MGSLGELTELSKVTVPFDAQRIRIIDIIRGVAVFGIFTMNAAQSGVSAS